MSSTFQISVVGTQKILSQPDIAADVESVESYLNGNIHLIAVKIFALDKTGDGKIFMVVLATTA
jgi:hypothetical protein